MKKLTLLTTAVLTAFVANVAVAEDRIAANQKTPGMFAGETKLSAQETLRRSGEVYRTLGRDQAYTVPQSIISRANCVAVVPNVVTAAAVIGGSHGSGVASCKTAAGKWSQPLFVNMSGVSFGAQIGVKSSDYIIYFTDNKAMNALKNGRVQFGADTSVVAGSFEKSFELGNAGAVIFQHTSGAFVGASVMGGAITQDEEQNRAYYGKNVQTAALLNGTESISGTNSETFTTVLP